MEYLVDERAVTYYNMNKERTAEELGAIYEWKSSEEVKEEFNAILRDNKDKLDLKTRNKYGYVKVYSNDGSIKLTVDVENKEVKFCDIKYKGNKNFPKEVKKFN